VTQVEAFEDGGHLGGGDLDATVFGLGKAKRAFFEAFVPEREAVAIPVENFS
jgi:hypothetical protein